MSDSFRIDRIQHPFFTNSKDDYEKWRRVFEGGRQFIDRYLVQFSSRETAEDFQARKNISYVPAHAKAAIIDIRNAIFQRMTDIIREGGPESYQRAVKGLGRGVDLRGNSMNSFLGTSILEELLAIGRVGIFVDKPPVPARTTLADPSPQPYLYYYQAEQIRSWHYNEAGELDAVLLEDHFFDVDEESGLVTSEQTKYRLMTLTEDRKVRVRFWRPVDGPRDEAPVELVEEEEILPLQRIPFVMLSLSNSLLADVADIQIALLNLASSDMNYALKSNFPFYIEQVSNTTILAHNRPAGTNEAEAGSAKGRSINVGVTQGRAYPKDLNPPAFIHPSPEPLMASMEKQERLKEDIRQLVNLSLSNIRPTRASAESKQVDNQGLEAGLSYIGLELEYAEREIAKIWHDYERTGKPATIKYPDNYELRTDKDRRQEAKELEALKNSTPSITYKKEICKQIARITLGSKIPLETLEKINNEIDQAKVIETDAETIRSDHEAGFVGTQTASLVRGYPEGEAEQAKKDHAERLRLIAMSQTPGFGAGAAARGVPDADADRNSGVKEKAESRNTDLRPTTEPPVRGEGK